MRDSFSEKKIKRAYQDFVKSEIDSKQIQRDKQQFLRTHFEVASPVSFAPAFALVPIFLFVFAIAGYHLMSNARIPAEKPQMSSELDQALQNEESDRLLLQPDIKVSRVSSQVGPIMIYQKTDREVPLTVIWVFPRPDLLSLPGNT